MFRRTALALALLALAGCPRSNKKGSNGGSGAPNRTAIIYYLTELKGQVEPCGCNSDPLGDLARMVALVEATPVADRVVLDAGGMLFEKTELPDKDAPQAKLKADLIERTYQRLKISDVGLGPEDLAQGKGAVRPVRIVENADAEGVTMPGRVVLVGGVKVGSFGLIDPEDKAISGKVKRVRDATEAARAAVERLRKEGAEVIVALPHLTRAKVKQLVRDVPGIDFAVVGQGVELGGAPPELVGSTWVLVPAEKGQKLGKLELHLALGGAGFADAIGERRAKEEIASIDERLPKLAEDLSRWEQDPTADPAFLAKKREEVRTLEARRAELSAKPRVVPAQGSWFVNELIPIKKGLDCAADIVSEKHALTAKVGEINLAAAKAAGPPPPADAGKPSYLGSEECVSCHKLAADFWKETKHAAAWKTIEVVGKHLDRDCVSCHVTGFDQKGGSSLASNAELPLLRDVQCESCHGPGSIHVAKDGQDKPRTINRDTPEATCKGCHPFEHSDTFDYVPYLRDVLGGSEDAAKPRHGYERWKTLGQGPRGSELRKAALDKAGAGMGKNCGK